MGLPDPFQCNERYLLLWILLRLSGVSPSNPSGGSGGIVTSPATYNTSSEGIAELSASSAVIRDSSASPRKIDIINVGANTVWVLRSASPADAAAGTGYKLLSGAVLTVDEPTTDAFSGISPDGTQNVYYVERSAAS